MKKITICLRNDSLLFKYHVNKPVDPNLLNTSVIFNNELVFSDKYISENIEIVSIFLADITKEKKDISVYITNNQIAEVVLPILKYISTVSCVNLLEDSNISYSICEKIINLKNVKKVDCYSIPTFIIELFDKNKIIVESRNEVLFTSNFMQNNNLDSFSSIYYKKELSFDDTISDDDLHDFSDFCSINKYLKVIHLEKFSSNTIKKIVNVLSKLKKKNIVIQIHDDINDLSVIEQLKAMNKVFRKLYSIKLTLVYSKDYLEQNYLKQIIFITLKYCSILIFLIVGSVLGYIFYNNYQSEKKVSQITTEIKALMAEADNNKDEQNDKNNDEDDNNSVDNLEDDNKSNNEIQPTEEAKTIINSYDKLLPVNPDTVGWLTVNGTRIDYPVVKTTDNAYYLKYNFYKEKDYNGWVFMDYRNNQTELDDNTIIYAHNRYSSGVMFGTLSKVLENNWHKNESNLYITFNTLYENIQWKVFSIYGIDVTNDYLYTTFNDEDEYRVFLDKIMGRSQINLSTEVTTKDKILTLSTCLDNNRRLVVHAVKVNNNQ